MGLSDKFKKQAQAEQEAHAKRNNAVIGILDILDTLPEGERYKVMKQVCETLSKPSETYILQTRTPD